MVAFLPISKHFCSFVIKRTRYGQFTFADGGGEKEAPEPHPQLPRNIAVRCMSQLTAPSFPLPPARETTAQQPLPAPLQPAVAFTAGTEEKTSRYTRVASTLGAGVPKDVANPQSERQPFKGGLASEIKSAGRMLQLLSSKLNSVGINSRNGSRRPSSTLEGGSFLLRANYSRDR